MELKISVSERTVEYVQLAELASPIIAVLKSDVNLCEVGEISSRI